METPRDLNSLLKKLLTDEVATSSNMAPEDEKYLNKLIAMIKAGQRAIIVAEEANGNKLRYMFSNQNRAEAVSMLGKVIEATGRRIDEGGLTA